MTRDPIRCGERAGIDPNTGLECKPLTLKSRGGRRAIRKGRQAEAVGCKRNPVFFAPGDGSPIVWYSREKASESSKSSILMGYHPQTRRGIDSDRQRHCVCLE